MNCNGEYANEIIPASTLLATLGLFDIIRKWYSSRYAIATLLWDSERGCAMSNQFTYISLFSGAGVGCYGFKMEGFCT